MKNTPGSISYIKVNLALEHEGVTLVDIVINAQGDSVSPNTQSLYSAFQEIGLAFGNDGSDPSLLYIDLTHATGLRAWPISFMGYLSFRSDNNDSNCMLRRR